MGGDRMSGGELQRYEPGAAPAQMVPSALDQWVLVVRDVSRLAAQIADTPFVPDAMRGNPAAVTAAILSGREMGLGPLTSLQHIHVVKGKPGKSAEIMRAMVLAAGHEIRDVEVTDTRCVLEGRRHGEEQWTRASFTADQAKRAKIDLGGYPEDKLYARATTRLCRRKFADIVGGIALTIDELEDAPDSAPGAAVAATAPPQAPAPPAAAKRTARRRTARESAGPAPQPAAAPHIEEQAAPEPPLPGDEPAAGPAPEHAEPGAPATHDQLTKLHAQLGELGVAERDAKLHAVGRLVQRDIGSSSELTRAEASQAIDILARVIASDNPNDMLAILAELAAREDGEEP